MALQNSYLALPERCYVRQSPDAARAPLLLAWNAELAARLGLDDEAGDRARLYGGNELPPGAEPIALAYAGHQFGQFVPQLGDGRAHLLGEAIGDDGKRHDLQLKGSGRTPFSRGGDGKSALGPVLREYVVSEAMHRLGVPTTRALAAVATGEQVQRERSLPGAVMTRVAAGHLRIGSFQYLAARRDEQALGALALYAIERHYPACAETEHPFEAFFAAVVEAQAALVARWMALGFVHGVMNTDNTAISGETIDYGPCAFIDEFRHDKVFSSIDRGGRYAYHNQPPIAQWNLARLAECLLLLDDRVEAYEAALADFPQQYQRRYRAEMRRKLGLPEDDTPEDDALIADWLQHLHDNELDFTLSFRELCDGERFDALESRLHEIGEDPEVVAARMKGANPLFIPRNHQVERAIEAAIEGDLSIFEELVEVTRRPFDEQPRHTCFAAAPEPGERVTATFCGT